MTRLAFSIIVPTRDRPGSLARCLASLSRLKYQRDAFEVIVVNDGGKAPPADVIGQFESARLVSTSHVGPGAARNVGVDHSRFDHLVFIDDDCTAHPDWLGIISGHLAASAGSPVGGRVVNALESNRYARASQGLQDFLYRWYHEDRRGEFPFFTTNNLGVSRRDFDLIGGFDSTFPFASEDRDWCDRATHAGHALRYAPDAIVYHWHELSLSKFLVQHYRYGRGAVRFHSRRAIRRGQRMRLEHIDFYRGMFTAPFASGRTAPLSEAMLLFASQSASLAGFVTEIASVATSCRNGQHFSSDTVTRVPRPASLSIETSPSIAATSSRTMESPSPTPG
jgi:glycosyltransferase involved in cell wall biosynthesis